MEQIRLVFVVLVLLISVFSMLVVSFPIQVPSTKSNVEDTNLQKTKAHVLDKKVLNKDGNNTYESTTDESTTDESTTDVPETSMLELNIGLRQPFRRIFVNHLEQNEGGLGYVFQGDINDNTEGGTEAFVKASDSEDAPEIFPDEVLEDDEGTPHKKGDDPDLGGKDIFKIGGRTSSIPTEKTVLIPRSKTDYLGNWVYNPWGVTYGQLFRDTRLNQRLDRYVDLHRRLYNPYNVPKKAVCRKETVGYNVPYIKKYLRFPFYQFAFNKASIFPDIRREIYEKGRSEECHTVKQLNWRIFNECQMMRHMRMEYLIPNYPVQQSRAGWNYYIHYPQGWPFDVNPVRQLYG